MVTGIRFVLFLTGIATATLKFQVYEQSASHDSHAENDLHLVGGWEWKNAKATLFKNADALYIDIRSGDSFTIDGHPARYIAVSRRKVPTSVMYTKLDWSFRREMKGEKDRKMSIKEINKMIAKAVHPWIVLRHQWGAGRRMKSKHVFGLLF